MKPKLLPALVVAACSLCGCQTYSYRILKPAVTPPAVTEHPVSVSLEPLEYRFTQQQDRLAMRVINPTSDRLLLVGNKSFVIDPAGETHPMRGRVIGPHSYVRLLLPPVPFTFSHPDYTWGWGWGGSPWGWGWPGYVPLSGPYFAEGFIGPPPIVYEQALTVYDWRWKHGTVRLHMEYERGKETFAHEFELDREPQK